MWHRDADGEQRGEYSARGAGFMQLLADDRDIGRISALAPELLVESDTEQAGLTRAAAQIAGKFADLLPLVDVRQNFALSEAAHCLTQLLAFGRSPHTHVVHMLI